MQVIRGSLFGTAYGDALGAKTEFMRVDEIVRRFPPDGPRDLPAPVARVTDDTQMALAVGEALMAAEQPFSAETLEGPLRAAFVSWANSPDNNRAPGATCMKACDQLERGFQWQNATIHGSKGCGANMRVMPVGLLRDITPDTRAALAQFQAALTHGHTTALAASDLTAFTIADLAAGGDLGGLPARLRSYALSQREVYHAEWLGSLWQRPFVNSPEEFIAQGWDECLEVLDRLDAALAAPDPATDPCQFTGEGWVAEEAFATGLLCVLLFPEQPVEALRRAATTAGDSDSIACLAGSFAGAHLGMAAWPEAWLERIEYRARLEALASWLAR